ncbi:MAG: hypothetical protein JWN04_2734, partial [Myxococcaceae bacterium]|nr:hypothetical protein [Myxococcaceae bacterium]
SAARDYYEGHLSRDIALASYVDLVDAMCSETKPAFADAMP